MKDDVKGLERTKDNLRVWDFGWLPWPKREIRVKEKKENDGKGDGLRHS